MQHIFAGCGGATFLCGDWAATRAIIRGEYKIAVIFKIASNIVYSYPKAYIYTKAYIY